MKNYEAVQKDLMKMLAVLEERLERITNDVKHIEQPLAKDFEDQVTQMENDEVLDFLGNATRREIVLLNRAISRIDSGDYGICRVCNEPIGEERLKAIPYADLCIKCAERAEISN